MAKQFIDAAVTTEKDSMTQSDGAALTLTNTVRVLYDDTAEPAAIITTLERIQEKIRELEQ